MYETFPRRKGKKADWSKQTRDVCSWTSHVRLLLDGANDRLGCVLVNDLDTVHHQELLSGVFALVEQD